MEYLVTHKTEYAYDEPVLLCHNAVHLRPRNTPRQNCRSFSLRISPHPASQSDREDFFGNSITFFSLREPHARLTIATLCRVEVLPLELPETFWSIAWDEVPAVLRHGTDARTLDARQYVFDSPRAARDEALADFARPCFDPNRPLLHCVSDLTRRIHEEFEFDPHATDVLTPVAEVMRMKKGVCQDFAHMQIACLRSLGLAARYVSGYLLTDPPPGGERLIGVDASHAWISVYFPDYGWIDFDPTNGRLPSDHHVTVAWGRDYDDVCPVKGVILGGRNHKLRVAVTVHPVVA